VNASTKTKVNSLAVDFDIHHLFNFPLLLGAIQSWCPRKMVI